MTPHPLFPPKGGEHFALCQWLRPKAKECTRAILYKQADFQTSADMLSVDAQGMVARAGFTIDPTQTATRLLHETVNRAIKKHAGTFDQMVDAAGQSIPQSQFAAAQAAASIARDAKAPPYFVAAAVEQAAMELRIARAKSRRPT